MNREITWLNTELSRVLSRDQLERSTATRYERLDSAWSVARLVQPAASGVQSNVGRHRPTVTYGPYDGPAMTDDDVRRLEHPEEFECQHGLVLSMCARCRK